MADSTIERKMILKEKNVSLIREDKHPGVMILLLAWPVLVENVLFSLVNYVDTAMVGSMGAVATAAVSISGAPNWLINGTVMSVGVGFTALISRAVGAEEVQKAKDLIRQALLVTVALGIPVTGLLLALAGLIPAWMGAEPQVLPDATVYNQILGSVLVFRILSMMLGAIMRGYGDTKTPMITNVCVNFLNVLGNFLLIYPTREMHLFGRTVQMPGAGWGVAGAAAATAGSAVVGSLVLLAVIFLQKGPMRLEVRGSYLPDWQLLKTVFRISVPAALERIAQSTASIITVSTIATLGTVAVAADTLYITAEDLCLMPGFAFATAATTFVGQALGANRSDLAEKYTKSACQIASVLMVAMGAGLFFFAEPILGVFTPDREVIELGARCLKIDAFIQVPQMLAMIWGGAMRGAGDTKAPFAIITASMWGVRILGTVIGVRVLGFGLEAACIAMCADQCLRGVLFFFRWKSGKWKNAIQE